MTTKTMLSVRDLVVSFGRGRAAHHALRGVSFDVREGRTLGVVGESGSGKSTLARAIVGMVTPQSGSIIIDGAAQDSRNRLSPAQRARQVQMIFQDPFSSLNPALTVGESIQDGLRVNGHLSPDATRRELQRVLSLVHLPQSVAYSRPAELSGGMRQRVCIARALAANPRLVVADEITSALDASVQGSVLNLLRDIRAETKMTTVFISHNLAAVRFLADDIVVMERGLIVESGETLEVVGSPQHRYTRSLIAAVPSFEHARRTGAQSE